MKKLSFLILFAIAFIYGCEKQESQPAEAAQNTNAASVSVYVVNLNDDNPTFELMDIPMDKVVATAENTPFKNGNSAHTHGSFVIGATSFTWSGTQNNGGTHGSASAEFIGMLITMETECIMAMDNEAVYGGTITELENAPPFLPIAVGSHVYFKVIDNGEGSNAPADQFGALVAFSADSKCGVYTPDYGLWYILAPADVLAPGSVKVNN